MSRFVPKGVMPALVTPFTRDGDINEEGFRQVIDYTISKGATGVVPAGTTGEFSYMRTEERKKLLKLTVEYVDGRVPIIAGTGQNSTRATVLLTKYAADIGCDAALVISPYYLRPGDKGYYEHYATVARQADLPVILYNLPQCTLGVLNSNVVEDLSEIDNVVGIKDSSGNMPYLLELLEKVHGRIEVIIGADECFLSAVAAGVKAAILATANLIPHIWLEIMHKVQKGKIEEAAKLQNSVQTLARLILKNGAAPPIKAGLRMLGINAGKSRMPLDTGGTLTPETKEEIRLELQKLGVLEELKHPSIQRSIQIFEALLQQGFTIDETSNVKQSSGSNNTVSVAIATGSKNSPLGGTFVKLLTMPKIGHEALMVILEPNLAVRPSSIMFPMRRIESMRQASLFYGPVQSGAARAIASYLEKGKIPNQSIEDDVMVMALDVDLNSKDRRQVVAATQEAVEKALAGIWR
ncbi:MAG: 4-hydroxy-tetrahydrodipicolinate synthase [Candidatus Thorarchaeota archaeon]|nr:MAG: 4-hydroxy-tetrahydrodipicolinate synthase [Candidatus Thorarchaeota archaeon]